MENILAYIEFTQFQMYLRGEMNIAGSNDSTTDISINVQLPSNIPLSVILEKKQSDDASEDLKIKAHQIYKKYVAFGSELEINVSWESREKVINILDDLERLSNNNGITINDLYPIFDDCKSEIWTLMLGSLFRFRSESANNINTSEIEHV